MDTATIQDQTVLIVDDDAHLRKALQQTLAQAGYGIIEAASDAEGLRQCRICRPDLIISDLFMPEKGGIEMIKKLKALFPDIKIIAISGGCYVGPDRGHPGCIQRYGDNGQQTRSPLHGLSPNRCDR